jgi:uncharacterized protein
VKVAVTGSSGLIGQALVAALREDGHTVARLVRRATRASDEVRWDPTGGGLDPAALAGVDAVVHLSGAGVGDHRWTEQYKRVLYDSRIDSTRAMVTAMLAARERGDGPGTFLCASAVGWYGETGDRVVDETAPAGHSFLATLCRDWEAATEPAAEAGIRVARLRSGLVLSRRGGLLGKILPLFKLGLGGRLGHGRQYWPWISLADEIGAITYLLSEDVHGPVNLTGPTPVTNAEFTRRLGRAVHRPALAWVPRTALRVALGEFAGESLGSQRAVPSVLESAGYRFQHPDIDTALAWAVHN